MSFLSRLFNRDKKEPAEIKDVIPQQQLQQSFSIPLDVMDLLWFSDGPYANYSPDKDSIDVGNSVIISFSFHSEPSCISVNMGVQKPKNKLFLPPLDYYPQYSQLTPEQRWRYLTWLRDVTTQIDIGYVFLFYYGLERHLFMGKFEPAFKMVTKLRKYQFNNSFESYSNDAMLASMIYHHDFSMYDLFEAVQRKNSPVTTLQVVAKYQSDKPLTAPEIMRLTNMVGYVNKRYIAAYPDIFLEELEKVLVRRYGASTLPWDAIDLSETPASSIRYMANLSLPSTLLQILDITENDQFKNTIRGILMEVHEIVKIRLRKERSELQKTIREKQL